MRHKTILQRTTHYNFWDPGSKEKPTPMELEIE